MWLILRYQLEEADRDLVRLERDFKTKEAATSRRRRLLKLRPAEARNKGVHDARSCSARCDAKKRFFV